ncbi:MAG TPA: lipocalin family protein [Tenuifilaceae bacterium]|nr:lipocalin family protein [Tenuifilaceae bacterium]
MKKIIFCLIACLSIAFVFTSCEKEEESFDESLLIGEWVGTEYFSTDTQNPYHEVHYKYFNDKSGYTWDVTDDVLEDEAQPFTWTLVKSDLTQIHIMGGGQELPKYYTVTELTETTLKYEDRVANPVKKFTYTKVN